jgi:hypothetical protein
MRRGHWPCLESFVPRLGLGKGTVGGRAPVDRPDDGNVFFASYRLRITTRARNVLVFAKLFDINKNRCTMYSVLLERLVGGEVQIMTCSILMRSYLPYNIVDGCLPTITAETLNSEIDLFCLDPKISFRGKV